MDNIYFIFQQTIYLAVPLLVVALGAMFCEKSGITNIGLEGTMIAGAFGGILFMSTFEGTMGGQGLLLLSLIIAGLTGVVFSLLFAFATINLKSNQIISGMSINMLAPALMIFIFQSMSGVTQVSFINQFKIAEVPILSYIPLIGDMFFKNVYITTYIGLALLGISWVVLYKSRFGLRLRACGENPQAVDSVGIDIYTLRYIGVIISGFLSGIGGIIFVIPISSSFNASIAGYGYLALAVLILGRYRPVRILVSALLFSLIKTIFITVPFFINSTVPTDLFKMIPYILILVMLGFSPKNKLSLKNIGSMFSKVKEKFIK